MRGQKCSECGTVENVKLVREYPDLADLLRDWHAYGGSLDIPLCPKCASAICGGLGEETVKAYPLDLSGDADQEPESHSHSWIVFSTVMDQGWLMVRCKCGGVGVVKDPTSAEWGQAFHAPFSPYSWPEPDRVDVLKDWTTALDKDYKVWTVVRG